MKELITAVNAVMAEAKNISKNSNVGTGRSSYKGVKDIDVKALLQPLMQKNQLAIFQTGMEVMTEHEVWEQDYNGQAQRKKQVFTEVKSKYLLMHSSGQSVELAGLGHGIDSQDKGAGKAQTYALKMVLIYTFLVPVGDIDDTDNTHSNEYEVPTKKQDKEWLNRFERVRDEDGNWEDGEEITDNWKKEVTAVRTGAKTFQQVKEAFNMSKQIEKDFLEVTSIKK